MNVPPWAWPNDCRHYSVESIPHHGSGDRYELDLNLLKQEIVIIRNNRGIKRLTGLLLIYVALPLVICALIILIKSLLLSVISLEWSRSWIFQTLIDHWLECFLIGVLNFKVLTKWMRGRGSRGSNE